MNTLWACSPVAVVLALALVSTPVAAAEVEGTLVTCNKCRSGCNSCGPTVARSACCDPSCAHYGPIRRFFRRVFHPGQPECCPKKVCLTPSYAAPICPAPACPAPGFAAPVIPGGPGPVGPAVVVPPPASIGAPPAPPPAVNPFPSAGSSLRGDDPRTAPGYRQPRLDLLAHREKEPQPIVRAKADDLAGVEVLLIHADQPSLRRRLRSDEQSRISGHLPAGEWLIYTVAGQEAVFHGILQSQTGKAISLKLSDRH